MHTTSSSIAAKKDDVPDEGAASYRSTTHHAAASGKAVAHKGQAFMQAISTVEKVHLLRFANTLTRGDIHSAEDLVQEAFLRAWRHADRLVATEGLARPWLYTVIRRLAIDSLRARRARPVEVSPSALDTAPAFDPGEDALTAHVLRQAMAELPPFHREVLAYRYYLDQSIEDTAAALGLPIGTVKSRTSHALNALRRALTSRGVQPYR
ncbi:sigma-70 family RNA polymerase sigma factor [Streptomyces sp. ICN441]|uniref:sigma-70 family RNA polymerase sigma factor n=1 Tax=Streptomyces sp. ICN441 TaxID=2558286 RepID=UPI00141AD72A|nr:sigma-70 family RNA polymerase sigma factor [Streptomyces sp. ICN441]